VERHAKRHVTLQFGASVDLRPDSVKRHVKTRPTSRGSRHARANIRWAPAIAAERREMTARSRAGASRSTGPLGSRLERRWGPSAPGRRECELFIRADGARLDPACGPRRAADAAACLH
jgi:hypothetical protein